MDSAGGGGDGVAPSGAEMSADPVLAPAGAEMSADPVLAAGAEMSADPVLAPAGAEMSADPVLAPAVAEMSADPVLEAVAAMSADPVLAPAVAEMPADPVLVFIDPVHLVFPSGEVDQCPHSPIRASVDSSDSDSDDGSDEAPVRVSREAFPDDDDVEDNSEALVPPRTKNELVEPLDSYAVDEDVTVDAFDEVHLCGHVLSVVHAEQSIVVEAVANCSTLDVMSLLCDESRRALGKVCDVFGPVAKPFYMVKYSVSKWNSMTNSSTQTDNTCARLPSIGDRIFCVTKLSVFVTPDCLKQIKSLRGSDASNPYDEEVGPEDQDFSDDEAEQRAKQRRGQLKRPSQGAPTVVSPKAAHGRRRVPMGTDDCKSTLGSSQIPFNQRLHPSQTSIMPQQLPVPYHFSPSPGVTHYSSYAYPQQLPFYNNAPQPLSGLNPPHAQLSYHLAPTASYPPSMSYVPGLGFLQSTPYLVPSGSIAGQMVPPSSNEAGIQRDRNRRTR